MTPDNLLLYIKPHLLLEYGIFRPGNPFSGQAFSFLPVSVASSPVFWIDVFFIH